MAADFKINFTVRDYECDIQGRVNNAVYLNYLEHTRHLFLKEHDINFIEMHNQGEDLVVIRVELDYKLSLKADEEFYVTCSAEQVSRLRFAFKQDIYRSADDKQILGAFVIGTCINPQGRVIQSTKLMALGLK